MLVYRVECTVVLDTFPTKSFQHTVDQYETRHYISLVSYPGAICGFCCTAYKETITTQSQHALSTKTISQMYHLWI